MGVDSLQSFLDNMLNTGLIIIAVIFVVGIMIVVAKNINLESMTVIICSSAFLLLVSLLGLWIVATIRENQEWEQFMVEKQCVLKEHIKGDIRTGVGVTNGKVGLGVMPEPDKEAYLCNDGVLYWR